MKKRILTIHIISTFALTFLLFNSKPTKAEIPADFKYDTVLKVRFVGGWSICKISECVDKSGDNCTTPGSAMRICYTATPKIK